METITKKRDYNPKMIFLSLCIIIDKLIVNKLKIEAKHDYKRIRVYPSKEAWEEIKKIKPDARNYDSSHEFSHYQNCLLDNGIMVKQRNIVSSKKNIKFEEKVNEIFIKEVMKYADSHFYFSLYNYFLAKLFPIAHPYELCINGKYYKSSEEDIEEI